MSSSVDVQPPIEVYLQCIICYEKMTDMAVLACGAYIFPSKLLDSMFAGHTACSGCLKRLWETSKFKFRDPNYRQGHVEWRVPCPECRTSCPRPTRLYLDYDFRLLEMEHAPEAWRRRLKRWTAIFKLADRLITRADGVGGDATSAEVMVVRERLSQIGSELRKLEVDVQVCALLAPHHAAERPSTG
jgi:hypothetical protein